MQGIKRRIVYLTLFEGLAILITSTSFASLSGSGMDRAGAAAVFSSIIAVAWNALYNWLFERWEARQTKRGRSPLRRAMHALGFEGGLVIFLVPMIAVTLRLPLGQAFVMDIGLTVFFLVYAYIFNLIFDAVFGLPASAMPLPTKTPAP
ncbi:PACE efflux transporter [Paraburkholderia sp. J67]|uniref:PACE efflux transporter n=1 Tax=Paraburkholderia sp. J67 TaxID=2805435 RepID=UPI002ABDF287|nr:PACE efflux transporter [Paraburkholderia sp. J67]